MSSSSETREPATRYITLEELKNNIVGDGPGTKNPVVDSKLLDVLNDASIQVDMEIKPLVDDVPLQPGTEAFVHASKCVLFYARASWFEQLGQIDRAKLNTDRYESKLEALKKAITSDKPDRTLTVIVAEDDPLKDRTYPTSQLGLYLEQEFG